MNRKPLIIVAMALHASLLSSTAISSGSTENAATVQFVEVQVQQTFTQTADQVWEALGRFCSISLWQAAVSDCVVSEDHRGIIRTVVMSDNTAFVEHLDLLSRQQQVMAHSIITSPIPLPGYHSEQRVVALAEGGSQLVWTAKFIGSSDASESQRVAGQLQLLFEAGLKGMVKLVESRAALPRRTP